jgi:hypothetical protein
MLTTQIYEQYVGIQNSSLAHGDINRLLAAAVVSRQFCNVLLTDPARAISMGYAGEHFSLSTDEYSLVLSAKGSTLPEFAQQLCNHLPAPKPVEKAFLSEKYQVCI